MPQKYLPSQVAQAFRAENRGRFDRFSDKDLLDAIKVEDPDTWALVDESLLGEELLSLPGPPAPPPPIPTPRLQRTMADTAISTGLRVVPAIAGGILGSFGGPLGTAAGGAGGGLLGELAGQTYEKWFVDRDEYNPNLMVTEAALNAFPLARAATIPGRIAMATGQGTLLGGASTGMATLLEEERVPTLRDVAPGMGFGAVFGGGVGGAAEGVGAAARAGGRGLGVEGMGGFGDVGAPPPRMMPANQLPIARAAAVQYEAEEQALASRLVSLYGEKALEGRQTDFYTALQAKDYLQQMAELKQAPVGIPPIQPGLTPPPPPPAPLLLPETAGPQGLVGAPPSAIRAYPPGVNPRIELVGAAPPRIVGGTPADTVEMVGTPPPSPDIEAGVARALEMAPGPPRLVLEGQRLPPRRRGPDAGQQELMDLPTVNTATRIRSPQFAEMGGAPPMPGQPRLPDVTTPRPLDREYTQGPNAGPRAEGELHGQPRTVKRYVTVAGKRKQELVDSALKAEDPGTYPAEVRREMARIAWELEQFPYAPRFWEWAPPGEKYNPDDFPAAGGKAKIHKAVAGAPVYHEILQAAGGARAHATREEVLQGIRAAILEGRGGYVSDAAAVIARQRLATEGTTSGKAKRLSPVGAGDELIGWVDQTGARALPEQDVDEFARSVREMEDQEVLAAERIWQESGPEGLNPETLPFFEAARAEGVRRGLIRPEQMALAMEGPGGAGGPSLFDYEGGLTQAERNRRARQEIAEGVPAIGAPPPAPPARTGLEEFAPVGPGEPPPPPELMAQPALPGAEGVRRQEIPTPAVAEAPFALTPPPTKPPITPKTGNLFQDLLREEGVLILDIPAGDRAGLKQWMKKQEDEHGGDAWYSRVEQAMEEGDWDRAWKAAASASVRSYSTALSRAQTPQQERAILSAVRGTPLQEDINAQIIAQARRASGLGTAPPVKDFPPSQKISQAGAARGKARVGPAGILSPGPIQKQLRPQERAHTLPRTFVETVISESDPELIHVIPGNEDTMLRLYRQIGDLALAGTNTRELKQYLKLTDQEIGQHFLEAVQESARILQRLSAFRQVNEEALTEAANKMSMGGALRGMLGSGRMIVGKRNVQVGRAGQIDPQATVDALTKDTTNFDTAMLANTLQRPRKASELELLQAATYPFMLMRWRTALRNAMSTVGRYSVDALDDALTIPLARIMGDEPGARLAKATLGEKTKVRGKGGAMVTPRTAWKEKLQDIYDFTAASVAQLPPEDARRTIALLSKVPDTEAHFMGWMAGGEEMAEGRSRYTLLNSLLDPKLQRLLTVFNRAQEFSGRGVVFDATMRAQMRAKGLDPNTLLSKPFDEIAQAVGGQQAMDSLLYNATSAALEATFSGQAARQSIPGALLSAVNQMWPLKLGYPFPKFNLVAAPRWIYDHSPAALLELLRFPMDTLGLTSGEFAGGRLYRGVRGQRLQQGALPELAGKRQEAIGRLGAAQRELLSTSREMATRSRQVTRLETRAQQGLPGTQTALQAAQEARDQLARRRTTTQAKVTQEKDRIRKLKAQEDKLLEVVKDAQGINAPTVPQYIARMMSGTAILGAAAVIRSQPEAEGTRWYEYRYDKGDGSDPDILDFRPYAPFAQYLYVADVMQDIERFTNWEGARAEAETEGWTGAIWNHYEGKYTRPELGAEFAKAFLSISRAAGTTLTLTDLLTQNGWPSMQDAGDAIIGTVGQFLSRFTAGATDLKDIAAGFSEEEAKVRVTPRVTTEAPFSPLAEPLAPLPGVSRIIPERISQTTGKPVTTAHPWLRMLAGVGSVPRDFVTEEVRRVGVPGATVFIRETGDYGLDKTVAESYAKLLQQELPGILELEEYQGLRTPARQRDFLQRYVFPNLKRAALAETRMTLGSERVTEATVRGEEARRRSRRDRMLQELEDDLPQVIESEVGEPPPPPPTGSTVSPPPPPPF